MKQIHYEQELIAMCQQNDRRAQQELFDRYKGAMYTLAFRMLNDEDEAHDALQETFISVFSNIRSFKGESAPGAWIKAILVRVALRLAKKKMQFSPLEEHMEDTNATLDGWIDGQMLDVAIRSLPAGCRSVFVLVEVEGFSHKEVAENLGVSVSTTKSQLHYAKKLLKIKLNQLLEA